ncbi:MAG: hypothetical protein ABSC33_13535 [Candidatus Sulfotelmatobacter sp.]|jgi:hypothetical protein
MAKLNRTFISLRTECECLNHVSGQAGSNPDFRPIDQRFPRLMLLLSQLGKSLHGLEALPECDLSEIVYGAIHLCGFVDPVEAEYAIAAVLETLEAHHPIPDTSTCMPRRDAPS